MSDVREAAEHPEPVDYTDPNDPTPWSGFMVLGGALLMIVGATQVIGGLKGLLTEDYYAAAEDQLAVPIGSTAWGWTHLIIGVAAILVAFGVFLGRTWARNVAIVLAVVSILVNVTFLKANPFGAGIAIAFFVLVIYALVAHTGEMTTDTVPAGRGRAGRSDTPFTRMG
jgi:hypothetical protein